MERNTDELTAIDPEELTDRDLLVEIFLGLVEVSGKLDELAEKVQDRGLDGEGFQIGRFES